MKVGLLALLALAAAPAEAGTRAVYEEREARRTIVFDVSDEGSFRAGTENRYRLALDGDVYEVAKVGGRVHVAHIEDLAAALKETTSPLLRAALKTATFLGKRGAHEWRVGGRKRVNGWKGREFRLVEPGDEDTIDELDDTRLVISADPALAPLGRAMLHYTADELYLKHHLVSGASAAAAMRTLDEIADEGAVIASSEGDIRLVSVEDAEIAPERLKLPAQPMSRAEIVALIRAKQNPFKR